MKLFGLGVIESPDGLDTRSATIIKMSMIDNPDSRYIFFEISSLIVMAFRCFVKYKFHENALGRPTTMKNARSTTMSQHLCLIMYGRAIALPTKYNLEPCTVSTYNVMKYATQSINDEQMRALFSMNQDNRGVEYTLGKHRIVSSTVCLC